MVKLGSLFDGSGGFPLAGAMHGIEPVWAAEVEPFPIKVTRTRFPNMRHYGDVSKMDGADVEPVDVITFGSPCQDLSVAGKRAGIHDGERSNLFFQAVRIIKEMRCATNGKYPRFAIWENVPGAFSSNRGNDFLAVLKALVEAAGRSQDDVPEPERKNDRLTWSKSGCIVGDGFSVAWRTLDAQYWGVPQRRARIYLVTDFAGERAPEILFKPDGVCGGSASRGEAREGSPGDAEGSADGSVRYLISAGFCAGVAPSAGSIVYEEEQSPTLKSANAGLSMHAVVYPSVARSLCARADSSPCVDRGQNVVCIEGDGNEGAAVNVGKSPCMKTTHSHTIVYSIQGNCIDRADTATCNGCGWREKATHTLNTIDRHAVVYSIGNGQPNQISVQDVCNTLDCMHDQQAVLYDMTHAKDVIRAYEDCSPTLQHRMGTGGNQIPIKVDRDSRKYIARRLTPLECCRLQGFPDGWDEIPDKQQFTDEEAEFWNGVRSTYARINGKAYKPTKSGSLLRWYNKLGADSARYKMWGNGIALPCAEFVLGRIAEHEK